MGPSIRPLAAILASLLLATPSAFAAGEVEVRMELKPGVWHGKKSIEQLQKDLTQIVQDLRTSDDPKITVEIGKSYYSVDTEISIQDDRATLKVPPGAFAFTDNLSELAGYFAYQLAHLKKEYEKEFGRFVDIKKMPAGVSRTEYVQGLIRKAPPDMDPNDRASLQKALQVAGRLDHYDARKADKDLKSVMNTAGIHIDLSGRSEENIKASLEAIDRLVAGGYDPWGMLSPFQKITGINNSKGILKRLSQKETVNTEAEFVRNYLVYLESKKVDITQQPMRGQPLTSEQSRAQQRALVTQFSGLGPAAHSMIGYGGTLVMGGVLVSTLWNDFYAGRDAILEELDNKKAPVEVKELEERQPDKEPPKAPMWSIPFAGTLLEYSRAVGGYFWDKRSWIGGGATIYVIADTNHRNFGADFNQRYRDNWQRQREIRIETQRLAGQSPPNAKTLSELVEKQRALLDFVYDGRNPDEDKALARDIYRRLFHGHYFSNKVPNEKAILEHYRSEAEKALEEETGKKAGSFIERHQLGKKRAEAELLIQGKLPEEVRKLADADLRVERSPELRRKYQNFLYRYFGGLSHFLASQNTERLIELIREQMESGKLIAEDRKLLKESLLRLEGVEIMSPRVKSLYADTIQRYFPEIAPIQTSDPRELKALLDNKKISQRDYMIALSSLDRSGSYTGAEKALIFGQLSKNGYLLDAARYLNHHFKEIVETAYDGKNPQAKEEFMEGYRRLTGSWGRLNSQIWFTSWLKGNLYAKALSLSDPKARQSATAVLSTEFHKPGSTLQGLLDWIISRHLHTTREPHAFMDALEQLRERYDVENRVISDYLVNRLSKEPELLGSDAALDRMLESRSVWQKLSLNSGEIPQNWEGKLLRKYEENSKKYDSYSFDPSFSERLQPLLIRSFNNLHPQATPEERLAFWKKLASRGPTGVSDDLFQSSYQDLAKDSGRIRIAQEALDLGLVWDNRIRAKLYQDTAGFKVDAKTLGDAAAASKSTLKTQLLGLAQIPANSADRRAAAETILKTWKGGFLSHTPEEKKTEQELKSLVGRWSQGQAEPGSASRAERSIQAFLQRNDEVLTSAGRRGALEAELKIIHNAFPETGQTYVELVDWLSSKTQTTEAEALYLKDRFINAQSDKKDIGAAVINEIIEEALHWDKPSKWALIRWLRGTGPVPEQIQSKLKRIGPESVRRMYATMPIFARQGFIGTLLGSEKSGLLSGFGQKLYHEQILNEILPREKEGAEIANELLAAFLKSVRTSHQDKKIFVMSYLLANHAEGSNVGVVLRRVLEANGLTGVKLAQSLASSDVLPPEIRAELAKTRDGANPPRRDEIFTRLRDVLRVPSISKFFTVLSLQGAASVKYTVKVRDPQGQEHALQIKREEAEKRISLEFEQLKIIIEDLIRINPARYAFLRGIVEATKAAIRRELSLERESQKTQIASEEYHRLRLPDGITIDIPKTSGLVEEIQGPKDRFFYLRSSEFASGVTMDKLDPKARNALAMAVLTTEHQLLFPEDTTKETHFDPDRHPGNVLFDPAPDGKGGKYQPIDWGQLIKLTPEDRAKIIRLMSFSQIFEQVGLTQELFERLCQEFNVDPAKASFLEKKLRKFFPNTSGKPRSGLTPYYYLLSKLETAGLPRKIVHYDFIKAIYQLEPYEEILAKETHPSPRRTLADKVKAEAQSLTKELKPTELEKIKTALLQPKAALTAARNLKLIEAGVKPIDDLLGTIGISQKGRDKLLRESADSIQTGADLEAFLSQAITSQEKNLSEKDLSQIKEWQRVTRTLDIQSHLLSAADYAAILSSGNVRNSMQSGTEEKRKSIAQPKHQGLASSIGSVYGAEFFNALFWALWDHDPKMAERWLREMAHPAKHAGFAAFAVTSGLAQYIGNATIPMSQKGLRYLNQGGFSMALGMTAQDIVRRKIEGQSTEEIMIHLKSDENLKEMAYATASFMAAETLVKPVFNKAVPCKMRFRKLAEMTAVFVAAGAIDRTTREPLTQWGVLERNRLDQMRKISEKFYPRIDEKISRIRSMLKAGDQLDAYDVAIGIPREQVLNHIQRCVLTNPDGPSANLVARYNFCWLNLETNIKWDKTYQAGLHDDVAKYQAELRKLSADSTDSMEIAMIDRESDIIGNIVHELKQELKGKPPAIPDDFRKTLEEGLLEIQRHFNKSPTSPEPARHGGRD